MEAGNLQGHLRRPRMLLLLGIALGAVSAMAGPTFKINYLSKDFVYLKSGRSEGIRMGDTLAIRRNEKLVALAVVEYAADYSSSLRVFEQKGAIVLGDLAAIKSRAAAPTASATSTTATTTRTDTPATRVRELPNVFVQGDAGKTLASVRGNIAYQTYLEKGFEDGSMRLSRQNIRMNLRTSGLAGSHYSMRLDMYASQRNNLSSGASGSGEWDNRVNRFSLGYHNPDAKLAYEIGRVIPDRISSIGYIDGGVFTLRPTESQYLGAFGGSIPWVLYYDTPISIQKYGGFYGLDFTAGPTFELENTVGFGGEYNGSVISREFLNLRNSLRVFRSVSLSQVSEIDVNRDWRREKAGRDFELSSLYLNGNWKASKSLSLGIQYDTRKNYHRLQTRSLADSLFDHATRMGLHENLYWRFLPHSSLYLGLGHSFIESQSDVPYNYSVGYNVDNLIFKRLYLNANYTGFEAASNGGYNGSATLRKSFLNGNDLSLGYGRYRYEYHGVQASTLGNDWVRVGGTLQFLFKTYFASEYEYNWGDVTGHRGFVELGYWL
ncbi:MAG TPA: hypothetical protein VK465_09410 [Fibrobacteria bacterium]|nr:hypothetical protein [Fibrobacteria bacterium]